MPIRIVVERTCAYSNNWLVYRENRMIGEVNSRKSGYQCHGIKEVVKALFRVLPAIPEDVEVEMRKVEEALGILVSG